MNVHFNFIEIIVTNNAYDSQQTLIIDLNQTKILSVYKAIKSCLNAISNTVVYRVELTGKCPDYNCYYPLTPTTFYYDITQSEYDQLSAFGIPCTHDRQPYTLRLSNTKRMIFP